MATQTFTDTLLIQECINCGITFGVPPRYDKERRQDRRDFYCPNGHPQHYTGKNDAERAKQLEQELANVRTEHPDYAKIDD